MEKACSDERRRSECRQRRSEEKEGSKVEKEEEEQVQVVIFKEMEDVEEMK